MGRLALLLVLVAACGGAAPAGPPLPASGVVLLALHDGSFRGSRALGSDPLAVAVSADGRSAFVSDNVGGVVEAVSVPDLRPLWQRNVGGRPGPLLVTAQGTLLVSLFAAAEVIELATADGSVLAHHAACQGPGQIVVTRRGVMTACASHGFGAAWSGMTMWRADASGALLRGEERIPLPPHMHPFWLEPDGAGGVLVAAEGDQEDRDPGGVFAVSAQGDVKQLLPARDPDQVALVAGRLLVAAHGEHAVLTATPAGSLTGRWAAGSSPVALAGDLPLGLLVVVTNARE
ncbi:MAG TPA: hypothetical protein VF134_08905 [Candidatus Dormibacteraeota bacterium]